MSSCRPIFLFSVYKYTDPSSFFSFFSLSVIWHLSISQKLLRYVSVVFFAFLSLFLQTCFYLSCSSFIFFCLFPCLLFSSPNHPLHLFYASFLMCFFLAGSNHSVDHGYPSAAQTESGVGRVITSTLIMEATRHCISIISIKYGLTEWIMEGL